MAFEVRFDGVANPVSKYGIGPVQPISNISNFVTSDISRESTTGPYDLNNYNSPFNSFFRKYTEVYGDSTDNAFFLNKIRDFFENPEHWGFLMTLLNDKNIWQLTSNYINQMIDKYMEAFSLHFKGFYPVTGDEMIVPFVLTTSEPNPLASINYWAGKGLLKSDNFIFPLDAKTGLPLGAWPSNYADIPLHIDINKTYLDGKLIMPITPISSDNVSGYYSFVYEHNGIDFMAFYGSPVYSPVSGTILYSEWGHTSNKGSDETAYTVRLRLDEPLIVDGTEVWEIFLTHMSGIRYRCPVGYGEDVRVNQGDLIGFSGHAAGSSTTSGWAPHLHMTFYPKTEGPNYDGDSLFRTSMIESIYGLSPGERVSAGN